MPLYNERPKYVLSRGDRFVPAGEPEYNKTILRVCMDWGVKHRTVKVQRTEFRRIKNGTVPPPLTYIFVEDTQRAINLMATMTRNK